jgi:hypothetical protein
MEVKTDEDKAKFVMKQQEYLAQIREPYEHQIDEIIRFVNHSRRKINDEPIRGVGSTANKGKVTGTDVYDGTALSAAKLAADGIHGYMCSASIHWFDYTLPGKMNFSRASGMRAWSGKRLDEYPQVAIWLEQCEEVMYPAFSRSNFYEFHPNFVLDGLTIGTPTAIIEEDIGNGRVIFTPPHFRECYIHEDQFGQVDTLYRKYNLTLKQMVKKFGREKVFSLHPSHKREYESNPYTEKEVLRAIFPRSDYDTSKMNGKNKPIASIWVLPGGQKKFIEESGYWDLPSVTWRWWKNNDEIYGRSPAWDAYVDIILANQQGKTNLIAGHKMVDPPMTAPSDLRGKIQFNPGGRTWIDGSVTKDKIPLPLQTGIQLPYGIDQQERRDKIIRDHFHTDFFLMLTQAAFAKVDLTATQVLGMQGEQAAVLGTRIGRHQTEALNPIMDRVFNIETRAGRIPEPPEILQEIAPNGRIEIDYMGPLSQAQRRLFKLQSIRGGIEMATMVSQAFPSSSDMVDGDKTMKEALDAVGFPATCYRPQRQVDQIRKIRQQKQEVMENVEVMGEVAKASKNMSKKIEEGSGLDQLANG